jgi:membrane protease YdiL (CAAX protease family)
VDGPDSHNDITGQVPANSEDGEVTSTGAADVAAAFAPVRNQFPGVAGAIALLFILFGMNIAVGVVILISSGMDSASLSAYQLAIGYVLSFGVTLWIGILLSRSSFGETLRLTSFNLNALVPVIAVLFGLWIVLIQSLAFMTRAIPIDSSMMEEMSKILFKSLWIGVPLLVVAAPVIEEALFRGVLLRGFLERYQPWKAIVLSAGFFSFAHFNIMQLPASFAVGLFMGWVYYRTRSLLLCMLLHAFHNLALAFVGQYVASLLGLPEDATEVPFVPWWLVAVGVAFIVLGAVMAEKRFRHRKLYGPSSQNSSSSMHSP